MSTIEPFDYSVDLTKSILWQYGTTGQPNIQKLIEAKQAWYDVNQTEFWEDWFTDVFDLRTCNAFGCNVWAIILGVSTNFLAGGHGSSKPPWGFDVTNLTNFNNYNFSSHTAQPITFTLAEQRLILQLRARQIVSRCTIPEVNRILADLIKPIYGPAYMVDNYNMSLTLVCKFVIPTNLQIILTEFDLIPRSAGCALNVVSSP